MEQHKIEQFKKIINDNNYLSVEDKIELYGALEVFNEFDGNDLEKCPKLIKVVSDVHEFLRKEEGKNREDKLLEDYGLTRDSSKEELEAKRDSLIDKYYKKSKTTKYIDKAKYYRKELNLVKEDFDILLSRYNERVLSGNLKDEKVIEERNKVFKKFIELLDNLSKFSSNKASNNKDDFNYIYEGMSDKEILESRNAINSMSVDYANSGNNNKEYLEPIEYIPNTNIRKPRTRGVCETDEQYQAFLQEYYSRYDFNNTDNKKNEDAKEFYNDKLNYAESQIQKYFENVRFSISNLRWLYNLCLNETATLNADIQFYNRKINEDPSKRIEFYSEIKKARETQNFYQSFIEEYEDKLEDINSITNALYNLPSIVGDCALSIEFIKEGNDINASISPIITLVDSENRKRYGNYSVDSDGSATLFDEYQLSMDSINEDKINAMLTSFIQQVIDEKLVDIDIPTIKSSNVEVIVGGRKYVMPYNDLSVNITNLLNDQSIVISTKSYKDDPKVSKYVETNNKVQKEETKTEDNKEEKTEQVVEEKQLPRVNIDNNLFFNIPKQEEQVVTEEPKVEENNVQDEPKVDEIIQPEIAETTVEETSDEEKIEDSLIEENTKQDEVVLTTEDVQNSEVQSDDIDEDYIDEEMDSQIFGNDDDFYEEDEEEIEETTGTLLNENPLTEEEKRDSIKVIASRTPVNLAKTISFGTIGGALSIFGLLNPEPIAVVGGVGTIFLSVVNNWKNISRAIQKFKLKKIAKHHDAKVYFGMDGKVVMRNKDGSYFDENKTKAIQKEIDKKINAWIDEVEAPRVTLDNLEHSFVVDYDGESRYTVSKNEEKEYEELKEQESSTNFEDIDPDIDIFGTTDNEEVDEEQNNLSVEEKVTEELLDEICRLNPELANSNQIKKDDNGYYIQVQNPNDIIVPEGYQYIKGVGINNYNNPYAEAPVQIDIIANIDYANDVEYIDDEVIDNIINEYGEILHDIQDDDIDTIINQGKYNREEVNAAAERYNHSRGL